MGEGWIISRNICRGLLELKKWVCKNTANENVVAGGVDWYQLFNNKLHPTFLLFFIAYENNRKIQNTLQIYQFIIFINHITKVISIE